MHTDILEAIKKLHTLKIVKEEELKSFDFNKLKHSGQFDDREIQLLKTHYKIKNLEINLIKNIIK